MLMFYSPIRGGGYVRICYPFFVCPLIGVPDLTYNKEIGGSMPSLVMTPFIKHCLISKRLTPHRSPNMLSIIFHRGDLFFHFFN